MSDAAALIAALGGLLTAATGAIVVLLSVVRRLRRRHAPERATDGRRRILLVDDDDDDSRLFAVTLRSLHVEVIRASSAEEAIDLMRREGFALMVVDVRLPGLSGPDLVERLRSPVVLVSGLPEEELQARAVECGADGWIRKTGDLRAMREAVARLLG